MTEEQDPQAASAANAETTEQAPAQAAEEQAQDRSAERAATPEGDAGTATSDENSGESTQSKKKRTKSTARKTRTVELTLTVTGTAEGEWQAELMHGGKRVVQGIQVPAAAVSKAAKELHEDISDTIENVLQQAREQHEAKLAELEAEVERVRRQLADLEG
ncbi:DUF6319 family protein [Salinifilum aidingensis]